MPTTIPNFLNNTQSPLGAAFRNLAGAIASRPDPVAQQKAADDATMSHWKLLGLQGLGGQLENGFPMGAAPSVGTGGPAVSPVVASTPDMAAPSPIAAMMGKLAPQAAPAQVPVPSARPDPQSAAPMPAAQTAEVQNPVMQAFAQTAPQPAAPAPQPSIDYGQYAKNALFAGVKPEDAGGYTLLGNANTYGARDPRTINSAIGAGKSYDQTAEKFDIGAANDLHKADQTAQVSRDNNTATNLTSRQNNSANISKDYGIASMHEKAAAEHQSSMIDPNATQYDVAYAEAHGGQLPPAGRNPAQVNADKAALWADMHNKGKDMGWLVDGGIALNARKTAANKVAGIQAPTQINEDTVNNSINILHDLTKRGAAGPTDVTGLNDLIVWGRQRTNDPDAANLVNGISTLSNDYARVMVGANGSAATSDAARNEAASRILHGYNAGTIDAVTAQMQQEMLGRTRSQQQGLQHLTGGQYSGIPAAAAAPVAEEHWSRDPATGKMVRTH